MCRFRHVRSLLVPRLTQAVWLIARGELSRVGGGPRQLECTRRVNGWSLRCGKPRVVVRCDRWALPSSAGMVLIATTLLRLFLSFSHETPGK